MDQELKAYLDQKFGAIDQRFDGVERRLDKVEQRLDGVEQRLDGVEQRLDGVEQRLAVLEQAASISEQKLSALDVKVNHLGVEIEDAVSNLRAVAEGHSVIYRSVEDRYKGYRQEVDEVRSMLTIWNQLLTSRVDAVARDVKELRGRVEA